MKFYLGTHQADWLKRSEFPLFVSRRRLSRLKRLSPAVCRWAMDSGGFTELSMFGRWKTSPKQYAEEAERMISEIGSLDWAATQDWMCEPIIRFGGKMNGRTVPGTGKSVLEHQERSVQSYLDLSSLSPNVPWAPVLQGWTPDEYLKCAELYRSAGVNLHAVPVVGVGTVCRRQGSAVAAEIMSAISTLGLKLHGFGLKIGFLKLRCARVLTSFDSMAWSFRARRSKPLPECSHRSCSSCYEFASQWRDEVLRLLATPIGAKTSLEIEV